MVRLPKHPQNEWIPFQLFCLECIYGTFFQVNIILTHSLDAYSTHATYYIIQSSWRTWSTHTHHNLFTHWVGMRRNIAVCVRRSVRGKLQHHNIILEALSVSLRATIRARPGRSVSPPPPPKSKRALLLFFQGGSALDKILAPCTPTTLLIYSMRNGDRQMKKWYTFYIIRAIEWVSAGEKDAFCAPSCQYNLFIMESKQIWAVCATDSLFPSYLGRNRRDTDRAPWFISAHACSAQLFWYWTPVAPRHPPDHRWRPSVPVSIHQLTKALKVHNGDRSIRRAQGNWVLRLKVGS